MFGYFLSLDSLVSYNVSPEQHPDKVVTVMAKHSYDKRFGKRLAMSVTGGESENDRMPLSFLFFIMWHSFPTSERCRSMVSGKPAVHFALTIEHLI